MVNQWNEVVDRLKVDDWLVKIRRQSVFLIFSKQQIVQPNDVAKQKQTSFLEKDQITCISPLPQSSLICKPPPPLILDGNWRYLFLSWPALPCSSRLHPLLAVSTEGQAGACLRPCGLGGRGDDARDDRGSASRYGSWAAHWRRGMDLV
jgi:hypothetical protein